MKRKKSFGFHSVTFLNQFDHLRQLYVYFCSKCTNLSYDFIAVVMSDYQEFERLHFHQCTIFCDLPNLTSSSFTTSVTASAISQPSITMLEK